MQITLETLLDWFAESLREIDRTAPACTTSKRTYQAGVGPYGEAQLAKLLVKHLLEKRLPVDGIKTKRLPDILIPDRWAVELKLARPFGDNGVEAEHWSQNLLHPYPGNVSALGDAVKLQHWIGEENRAVIVIGYEHDPPKIALEALFCSFEAIAQHVMQIKVGPRVQRTVTGLIHPVHQRARVVAWEINPAL